MTVSFDESEHVPDRFNRNSHGWPRIVCPLSGKVVAMQRPSGMWKLVFDSFTIERWTTRRRAVGFGLRPELGVLAASLGVDAGSELDAVSSNAAVAGGAQEAATMGTALHALLERWGRGVPVGPVPPVLEADWAATLAVLEDWQVVPVAVEQFVVWRPDLVCGAAGSADLFATTNRTDGVVVIDLKTSSSAMNVQRLLQMSLQLGVYANHTHQWDGSREPLREPVAGMNRSDGLVLHCERGTGSASMLSLDMGVGLELAELACAVRAARQDAKRVLTSIADVKKGEV